MHRLLKRQLKKCFGTEDFQNEEMVRFLASINESYNHFDDSQELLQRTMDISNEELFESNKRLVAESKKHLLILNSLKESVLEISPDQSLEDDDLLKIADVLKEEIVKRKAVENELLKAREIAESSLRSKETFFANMSHEIRTPMNGIIGMTRLLKETNLTPEQERFQRIILSSAEDLVVIINDILDITKMSTTNFIMESLDFNLENLLENMSKLLAYKAEEKGIYLKLTYGLGLAKAHRADPTRLKQVFINLIGNAIKFTEKGGVELAVDLVKKSAEKDLIKFSIIDTGIGIAPDKVDSVFKSFVQEDESTNRKFGGTGLGLSISKELVELFGGELKVESEKGSGTKFYFTIELPHGEYTETPNYTPQIKDLKNLKILLVEDNEINVMVATAVLSKWNCEIDTVMNGKLAVEHDQLTSYDVILMDMQMPVMDGLEATSHIRKVLHLNTPIIGFTANALKGEKENCLNVGMNDYITKPFEPDDLYEKIDQLVNH